MTTLRQIGRPLTILITLATAAGLVGCATDDGPTTATPVEPAASAPAAASASAADADKAEPSGPADVCAIVPKAELEKTLGVKVLNTDSEPEQCKLLLRDDPLAQIVVEVSTKLADAHYRGSTAKSGLVPRTITEVPGLGDKAAFVEEDIRAHVAVLKGKTFLEVSNVYFGGSQRSMITGDQKAKLVAFATVMAAKV